MFSRISHRAFTLIELLIVVAIIAILAAIAVPNFLEAQVRSKVSRAKADIRTLKTGLETYRVDYNAYIVDINGTPGHPRYDPNDEMATWAQLTTPIAYLTSVPLSPFSNPDPEYRNIPGEQNQMAFEYWGPGFWDTAGLTVVPEQLGIFYVIGAIGPNRKRDNLLVTPIEYLNLDRGRGIVYDPTNGTVSAGDILTSNKVTFY